MTGPDVGKHRHKDKDIVGVDESAQSGVNQLRAELRSPVRSE